MEIPSSTADSVAVLTQEKQERKNQDADVDMKLDGEETEESQTLLDIRREAAEALVSPRFDAEIFGDYMDANEWLK